MSARYCRKHQQNAFVEFNGAQRGSIIFAGGFAGSKANPQKRKFIEDILIIGSILTGFNWGLYSYRINKVQAYPVIPTTPLEFFRMEGKSAIEETFHNALNKILDPKWQKQYENGFHLRMFLNHANILNIESRFLGMVVVWEWLYPHLKNPNGATVKDETTKLHKILGSILDSFWPDRAFKGNIIFQALRNQLAHSGKVPINRTRKYVDPWMTTLDWENTQGKLGLDAYLRFFDQLTQLIVLKTLGIDSENILGNKLNFFLESGKLDMTKQYEERLKALCKMKK